ncbi:DUF885 domain-containing protein [Nonomuraea sp. NPDC059194]|uniref:DUF885 domain-containing protein n=1 Tax=Nonomuraea sp. NPDC059194 TaxID=3346764 RepID=UPI003685C9DE
MTPIFRLCDEHITRSAELDPVEAVYMGIAGDFGVATDYSPEGHTARHDLVKSTLARLDTLEPASQDDRRAADHLRERLEAQAAWFETGEQYRDLSSPFGLVSSVRDSIDLLPTGDDDAWRRVAAHLAAVPEMLAGWQASLNEGLSRGLPAARRQAVEGAAQAEKYAGTHDELIASYGEGPLAGELAKAAAQAHHAYTDTARYLREEYAPRATERDGVGPERYAVAARESLGADIDLVDAYEWGWAELRRIEEEMVAEAHAILPGASVDEAIAHLNETQYVVGADAFHAWLKAKHDGAIAALHGTHFDIAEPLHTIDVTLAPGSTSGSAYYTAPSEDLTRPGRTWWPVGGREKFATWSELSTVFHEGVPGHHLQLGAVTVAGDKLSRFAKFSWVSGHGEGWALYAERLADELGWHTEPGTRLGMLADSALRAARVVIDIGVHLDLPLPDGSRWTFEKACEVLRERGRAVAHTVHPEIVRYFGWPSQAISYKLGERAWLEARAEAARKPGFDLKAWHTAALDLGPIGLGGLRTALSEI